MKHTPGLPGSVQLLKQFLPIRFFQGRVPDLRKSGDNFVRDSVSERATGSGTAIPRSDHISGPEEESQVDIGLGMKKGVCVVVGVVWFGWEGGGVLVVWGHAERDQ